MPCKAGEWCSSSNSRRTSKWFNSRSPLIPGKSRTPPQREIRRRSVKYGLIQIAQPHTSRRLDTERIKNPCTQSTLALDSGDAEGDVSTLMRDEGANLIGRCEDHVGAIFHHSSGHDGGGNPFAGHRR